MKHLTFWFDVISPYAYLAFERLPQALDGLPVTTAYRPVLFAGLLGQWGQKGPAEIEPKRACLIFKSVLASSVTAWVLRKLACSTCSCWCWAASPARPCR